MANGHIEGMPSDLAEIIAIHRELFGGWKMVEDAGDDTPDDDTDDTDDGTDDDDDTPDDKEPNWKALSRSNERKLRAALKKLADAQSSEATPDERVAKAEERAEQAELRAARREVAIEYRLSKADAALLDDIKDEDVMHRIAARLAADAKRADADDEDEDEDDTPKRRVRRIKPRDGVGALSDDVINRRTARAVFNPTGQ